MFLIWGIIGALQAILFESDCQKPDHDVLWTALDGHHGNALIYKLGFNEIVHDGLFHKDALLARF